MITEDYVSFETAKLLKEKGFDSEEVGCHCGFYSERSYQPGYGIITKTGKEVGIVYDDLRNCDLDYDEYLRPTLQMAMKWLRGRYKLCVVVRPYVTEEGFFSLFDIKSITEKGIVVNLRTKTGFNTYEEACEAAIKYCLENLIIEES